MPDLQNFSLQDKVAVVTGAAGLLGNEHCMALAEAGAKVIVCDLDYDNCQALASRLSPQGMALVCDISDPTSLKQLRSIVLEEFGRIDILVNNAAINDKFEDPQLAAQQSRFENYPLEMWEQSLKVNLTGTFLSSQILGIPMVEQGKGSIINIASTYGIVAPDQKLYVNDHGVQSFYKSAAYPVTKGGILAFTRFLAAYWGKEGIRVNALSPGGVFNEQDDWFIKNYNNRTPLGRMANRADYRGALVFLASDASAYMTGANLVVDGGWTII